MNTVQGLLRNNFLCLTTEEKCSIKDLGRPKPVLSLSQKQTVKGREFRRLFKNKLYDRNSWICGCDVLNRFFCFPCLLFAKGTDESWTKTGVADLAHLSERQSKHEQSISHVQACRDHRTINSSMFIVLWSGSVLAGANGIQDIGLRPLLRRSCSSALYCK